MMTGYADRLFYACRILAITAAAVCLSNTVDATNNYYTGAEPPTTSALIEMGLEELMNLEVTSATRSPKKLSETPSAIFVITQDDIKRSGVTSIPEALRMAPGVSVARIGTDKWSISIRGFNGRFSNKLQVLMDGRSVYNPLFAGIAWDQQDTFMEDIERIEVIRGPSAAVWGANAVNGVINIITKKAADTQGTLLIAGGGSFEQGFVGARHGGKINDSTPYRVYAKGFSRDHMNAVSGGNANDNWHSARSGFRLDHTREIDQFTLQGNIFYNALGDRLDKSLLRSPIIQAESARGRSEGGNIRFRWDRTLSDRSSMMLQSYFDSVDYKVETWASLSSKSFDIDFQHRFPLFDRHDITWGLNYRLYHNQVRDTELIAFRPSEQSNHLFGAYIRDEFTLIPEKLKFTLGSRFDHNDFSGLEIQPNARLIWTPDTRNSVWASISRAVRTPSIAENDIRLNASTLDEIPGLSGILPFPVLAQILGSTSFNSEKLIAYELGYRHQFSPKISADLTTFFNDYSQLRNVAAGIPSFVSAPIPLLVFPASLNNNASGETYGVELSIDSRIREDWRIQFNYSYLRMRIMTDSILREFDPTTGSAAKVAPQHQISLRSNYDISERLQFNLWLRYVSSSDFYQIPGYVTLDSKILFKPVKNVELFLVGQNLLQQRHRETVSDFIPSVAAYVPRGIFAGAEWRF